MLSFLAQLDVFGGCQRSDLNPFYAVLLHIEHTAQLRLMPYLKIKTPHSNETNNFIFGAFRMIT